MPPTYRTERADRDVYRIMLGDEIAGFAMKLSNGLWSACDCSERRLTASLFPSPSRVAKAWPTFALPPSDPAAE